MLGSTTPKYSFWIIFSSVLLLLITTLASTSVYFIEVADLGLIKILPLSFWIGLALLGYLWYISRKSRYYSAAALVLTVSYLFVAPAIVKVPPWISQSYYPFGEARLINLSGHLTPVRPTAIFKSYHYWPGFLYLASTFTLVTGVPDHVVIRYFPLLAISLCGLLVFLILKVKMRALYSIFGTAWFLSAFFSRQQYFGPPIIGYVFFLMFFLVVSWIFFEKRTGARKLAVFLLFLFTMTTFTHVLSSFMAIVVVIALYLMYRFASGGVYYRRPPAIIAKLAVFMVVIFLSYNMVFAPLFFDWIVRVFSQIVSGLRPLGLYSEPQRRIGSIANLLNYVSILTIVLLNGFIVLLTSIKAVKNARSRRSTVRRGYFLFSMILLMALGLFAVTAEYGPHESYQRAFMFALIPLSYLCIDLLSKNSRIMPVVLVALLFLNIPAQYGSDSYTLATDSELAGAAFFAAHTPQNISCLHKMSMYIRYHDPEKNIEFRLISTLPPTSLLNTSEINKVLSDVDYVILSELQDNYYLYFFGENPLSEANLEEFNRIYDSRSLRTFTHQNKTTQP